MADKNKPSDASALSGLNSILNMDQGANALEWSLPGGPADKAMNPEPPGIGHAFDEARKVGDEQTQRFTADMLDMQAGTPVGSFGDRMGIAPKGAHSYFSDTSKSSHADVPLDHVRRTHSKRP